MFFLKNIYIARGAKYDKKRSMDMNTKMTKYTIVFLSMYLLSNLVALLHSHENFYKSVSNLYEDNPYACVYYISLNDSWFQMEKANIASIIIVM